MVGKKRRNSFLPLRNCILKLVRLKGSIIPDCHQNRKIFEEK